MKKEDLINCKVRVPTQEIKEKVYKKLLELGFLENSNVLRDNNAYIFIYQDLLSWQSENEAYFKSHDFKEIPYTDIIGEDKKEMNRCEAINAILDGKRVKHKACNFIYKFSCSGKFVREDDEKTEVGFAFSDGYELVEENPKPKEVVLYNYIVEDGGSGHIRETGFLSGPHSATSYSGWKLLKTETKTVILEG